MAWCGSCGGSCCAVHLLVRVGEVIFVGWFGRRGSMDSGGVGSGDGGGGGEVKGGAEGCDGVE